MEKLMLLLDALKEMPEYSRILSAAEEGKPAAVTGISQLNRSHLIAGLYAQTGRPVVAICQDDMAAKRMQQELQDFLGETPAVLPGRDLTLYDTAVVSRAWEHRRLGQLYALGRGETKLQIFSWEAMSYRTMPKEILFSAAFTLRVGAEYTLEELLERLVSAGYSRCAMVEGPGQFALRGDILDIYSPAEARPIRAEFYGDELDTMGFFDPDTQRRTENVGSAVILPVAETQPRLHSHGVPGLVADLDKLIARQKRRRNLNEPLIRTLETDREKLDSGLSFPAADRYLSLIYPQCETAMDYVPAEALVVLCDHGALHRAARDRMNEVGMQLDSMLQTGMLAGELCDFVDTWEDFCGKLEGRSTVYLDAFSGSAYPEACPPRILAGITAKQLPGYGGNLETAASDLAHYQKQDFRTLVLCGSRRRGDPEASPF